MSTVRFVSHYPIRFSQTDMAGIVYYPNFFDMFQSVVEDWFDRSLEIRYATLIKDRKIALPSVQACCNFYRPARIGDILELAVDLERIGRSSIAIAIDGTINGQKTLNGNVVLVTLSLENFRSIPIPSDIVTRLEDYRLSATNN